MRRNLYLKKTKAPSLYKALFPGTVYFIPKVNPLRQKREQSGFFKKIRPVIRTDFRFFSFPGVF